MKYFAKFFVQIFRNEIFCQIIFRSNFFVMKYFANCKGRILQQYLILLGSNNFLSSGYNCLFNFSLFSVYCVLNNLLKSIFKQFKGLFQEKLEHTGFLFNLQVAQMQLQVWQTQMQTAKKSIKTA